MTRQGEADVEPTVDIAADPNVVYALITDLPTMAELAEETTSMQWVNGDVVAPGARFKGTNSHGTKSWSTTCTVTDAEPGRVFAFDVRSAVVPVAHWRYDIVSPMTVAAVSPSGPGIAAPAGSAFQRAGRPV